MNNIVWSVYHRLKYLVSINKLHPHECNIKNQVKGSQINFLPRVGAMIVSFFPLLKETERVRSSPPKMKTLNLTIIIIVIILNVKIDTFESSKINKSKVFLL